MRVYKERRGNMNMNARIQAIIIILLVIILQNVCESFFFYILNFE